MIDEDALTDASYSLWVYADETKFQDRDRKTICGMGALVVTDPITQKLIDDAMDALRNDPDRLKPTTRRMDEATLERGCFHASDDSMNAHSPLARQIKDHVCGQLFCSFAPAANKNDEGEFRRHTLWNLVRVLDTRLATKLTFEQRSGFSSISAEAVVGHLYRGLDWSVYDTPLQPTHYPRVLVNVEPKRNPGLQIVDLLLWSVVQKAYRQGTKKSLIAENWCGLRTVYEATGEGDMGTWSMYVVNDDTNITSAEPDAASPYSVSTTELDSVPSNDALAQLYCIAERMVHGYANQELPDHAKHLGPELSKVSRAVRHVKVFTGEYVEAVARQFLRLFDMMPLLEGVEDDLEKLTLLKARRFMGLTFRKDLLHGVRTRDFFARFRRENASNHPELFGLSSDDE